MRSVRDVEIKERRVFLRVDYNVPMKDGKVLDNNRIKKSLPTIQYLLDQRAKIVIGTHVGRPQTGQFDPTLSTVPIAQELGRLLNYNIQTVEYPSQDQTIIAKINSLQPKNILMLENLRFDAGEETNDPVFAKKLASYAEIYVNDAFAVSHRANASVDAITNFIHSSAGLLLQSEITSLGVLLEKPQEPLMLVIGGVKAEDKAGMINFLAPRVDKFLIGGAVANTFLKAKGENVSQSKVDEEMIPECKKMLDKYWDKLVLPEDFVKEDLGAGNFRILDIGPDTQEKYRRIILNAGSIFWNGNLGYTEDEAYKAGTEAVVKAIIDNNFATKVAAGGDTVGFLDQMNAQANFSFVSTGGGAALEFLAGRKLPGIEALNRQPKI